MRNKIIGLLGLALAGLLLTGCASSKQYIPIAKGNGTAPSDPHLVRIYFMRPSGILGAAVGWQIQEGPNVVGAVGPGGHLVWERPPGEVRIIDPYRDTGMAPLRFNAEAGRTYFVTWGMTMTISTLKLLDEPEGLKMLKNCSSEPKPGSL